jgi:hypothetical protein
MQPRGLHKGDAGFYVSLTLHAAFELRLRGELEAAEAMYNRALVVNPLCVRSLCNRGYLVRA